ncbi:MAG: alpha/beta hydrolase [Pseudonocardia sp.]
MRRRSTLLAALGVVTSCLLAAGPATAAEEIVELPIAFDVTNTNGTNVQCSGDNAPYTVRGTVVAPLSALESGAAATLYLHAVTWGQYYFRFQGVPGYDMAHQLAQEGHVSVAVDRLGYGASDRPPGDGTCFGSEADVAHQMVQALRAGDYALDGADPVAFGTVFTGGSSVGGLIANLEAAHFGDVDGVMNLSWGDFAASPYAGGEVADASLRCAQGGDPDADPQYAVFARDSRDTFYFASAEPAVREAVPALNPDPCNQLLSIGPAVATDSLMLGDIDVPVLVMFGDEDAVFPPPALEQQAARYTGSPEVTPVSIPGASHYPLVEAGHLDAVAAIDAWLDAR